MPKRTVEESGLSFGKEDENGDPADEDADDNSQQRLSFGGSQHSEADEEVKSSLLEKEEKEEDSDNEKNEEEIEDEEDDVDEEGKRFSSMTYEEQRLYNIARNLRVMKSLGLANTPPPKKKQKRNKAPPPPAGPRRESARTKMKQAAMPSSPACSVSSRASSTATPSSSSSSSSSSANASAAEVNRNSGFNVLPSRSLLSEQEYEYGFQRAARRIYGNSAEDDPGFPKEVFAIYLALSKHIKHVYEAGISLHEAASSGSSSAVIMLNEHLRAQNVCHYRSTKDVEEFYYDTLMQKAGAEQVFADQALSLERMRVCQDQHSRALASMNSLQTSSMPAPASIKKRPKFPGSKYHEDCKKAIKEMVLRNPFEFLFLKSVSKYILCFCSHPLCPLTGSTPAENVAFLDSFEDCPGKLLQRYHDGQVDIHKKRVKCALFGGPDNKQAIAPLMESEDSTVGNFELPEQRDLFARCFLEKDTVRRRGRGDTCSVGSYEERCEDVGFVVEWTTRYLYFLVLHHDAPKGLVQDEHWKKKFYEEDHDGICRHLNERKISVFALVFVLHCMLTYLNVFSKQESREHEVKFYNTASYDGNKALKEWLLWFLSLGQDCNRRNYILTGSTYVYGGSADSLACVIPVPGVGVSQLDPRNQEILCFAHDFLKEMFKDGELRHAHELTPGKYGTKPEIFLCQPMFLSGWPKAIPKAWDEEDVTQQRIEER